MQAPVRPSYKPKQSRLKAAHLFPPVQAAGRIIFRQQPKLVLVKLPRNARKAPRQPVSIPLFSPTAWAPKLPRVSKHANQKAYPGRREGRLQR